MTAPSPLSVPPPPRAPSMQMGTEAEGLPANPLPGGPPTLAVSGATLKGTQPALLAGHFEIRGEIGRGGMGVVYEALDKGLDRRVALKKMRPEISTSKRDRDRFLAEAKAVARLQHPNIVSIYSIIEDGTDLYLVFEFVDGESLDQMLDRQARLAPAQVLPILARVADAIDYAHEQKIIHRDLKPSNIMVDKAGRPKVMDFGIAHQAKLTVSRVTHTIAAGTMAYMPPEQMLGQAVRESDVYAFAALTYEALTGGLPFPGPDFNTQKVQVAFKPPSQAAEGLKASLDGVFLRALQPEPKRRYTTSGEFVAALKTALA